MTTDTATIEMIDIKVPGKFKLILHNDNTTPFDVVLLVLHDIVGLRRMESAALCIKVHNEGAGVVGLFTEEHAKQLRDDGMAFARKQGYNDFTMTIEPEEK